MSLLDYVSMRIWGLWTPDPWPPILVGLIGLEKSSVSLDTALCIFLSGEFIKFRRSLDDCCFCCYSASFYYESLWALL